MVKPKLKNLPPIRILADMNSFTVYRSSAGSGKTRTLAREYLKLALTNGKDYMKHILAVTFTNKATQEMKERIILYLDEFASGKQNNLTKEICEELGIDEGTLRRRSQEVLSAILHQYSQFAVSTIDAFFQRVIRSFTRETGLLGNFRLESDNDVVMDEVIANLMDEVGDKKDLTEWIKEFSRISLLEGDSWNITRKLKLMSAEIHKEQFKEIEDSVLEASPEKHQENKAILHRIVQNFMVEMKSRGQQAMDIMKKHGITSDDFNYKEAGTAWKYFREFSQGRHMEAGQRILSSANSANDWTSKKSLRYPLMRKVAEEELMPILQAMVQHPDQERYATASAILRNYYAYGLISDLTRKLKTYKEENNVMLLSDASKFLNGIINDSDTPFIYEKVGSYFHHYLIDEFQDTSNLQWKNFIPLLKEAADQGNSNMIVGDVKQSIYRWRGGDLELLQHEIARVFGTERTEFRQLNRNFRSGKAIVEFNNAFFSAAASMVSMHVDDPFPGAVYGDVTQKTEKAEIPGMVQLHFIDGESWKEEILNRLPHLFEELQDKGVSLSEIAILVRENKEGQEIVRHLLQFQNSSEARKDYKYEVVSNESLQLDTAFSVGVLISALKVLRNPSDEVARGQLAFEVSTRLNLDTLFYNAKKEKLDDLLPEAFLRNQAHLRRLSLFELTEELIRIFQLGLYTEELAYLQAFQDTVIEFSGKEKTDLDSFLEWWELYRTKKSIQVSSSVDAARIITIHKAKGLQFRYVIIPFCNWKLGTEQQINTIWVQTKVKPFNDIGFIPVNFASTLASTYFREDYRRERIKIYLDNLNLLYVAFTRAEEGLFVFAPLPGQSKGGKIPNVNNLVYNVVSGEPAFASGWNGSRYETGTAGAAPPEPVTSIQTIKLDRYASCDWRKKLVIKREGAEFFNDEVSDKRSKINRGIVIHKVLSMISYKSEAKEVLEGFFLERAMLPDEQEAITQDVMRVMNDPVIGLWYTKDWEVMNEQLILLPGGEQKRIDRVMVSKKNTIIVDYKTGKKKEEDREQVANYAWILSQMGYPNVLAYLLYLDDLRAEPVMRNSNLSLF